MLSRHELTEKIHMVFENNNKGIINEIEECIIRTIEDGIQNIYINLTPYTTTSFNQLVSYLKYKGYDCKIGCSYATVIDNKINIIAEYYALVGNIKEDFPLAQFITYLEIRV